MQYRTKPVKLETARNMGWTRNHLVFAVGAWRLMGAYTQKQIDSGKWKVEVERRMKINGGGFDGKWEQK